MTSTSAAIIGALSGAALAVVIIIALAVWVDGVGTVEVVAPAAIEIPRRIVKVETQIVEIFPADYEILKECKALMEEWWAAPGLGGIAASALVDSGCLD